MDTKDILQQRREQWYFHCEAACKKLPPNLSKTAYWAMQGYWGLRQLNGKARNDARSHQDLAKKAFLKMSPEQRGAIFTIYFPQWMPYAEMAWQRLAAQPYQRGAARRAFRDLNRQEIISKRRLLLLDRLIIASETRLSLAELVINDLGVHEQSAEIGILLAAAVDANDSQSDHIFALLIGVAKGDNAVAFGRHIIIALLNASRPEGWEACEKLLLAAQRQEGLRQVILESADEGQPESFQRMLALILTHNLERFNSVARAVNVWLGMQWDVIKPRDITRVLAALVEMLGADAPIETYVNEPDPERCYIALFATAMRDVQAAFDLADSYLSNRNEAVRYVTVEFLGQAQHPQAIERLVDLLQDESLTVVGAALLNLQSAVHIQHDMTDVSRAIDQVLERLPEKERTPKPLVWAWQRRIMSRSDALQFALYNRGQRPLREFMVFVDEMNSRSKSTVLRALGKMDKVSAEFRPLIIELVGDKSSVVRSSAVRVAQKLEISADVAPELEAYMTRSAGDLRRSVIQLLLRLPDEESFASAQRLLGAGKVKPREAGLEMLRELLDAARQPARASAIADDYANSRSKLNANEQTLLDGLISAEDSVIYTPSDGFGLYNSTKLSPRIAPEKHRTLLKKPLFGKGPIQHTHALIESLLPIVEANGHRTFHYHNYQGENENRILDAVRWFPIPDWSLPLEQDLQRLPYADVWFDWWKTQPKARREKDGFGAVRALAHLLSDVRRHRHYKAPWQNKACLAIFGAPAQINVNQKSADSIRHKLFRWFWRLENPPVVERLLALSEHSLAVVANDVDHQRGDFRWSQYGWRTWIDLTLDHYRKQPSQWQDQHHAKLWQLLYWWEQPRPGLQRSYTSIQYLTKAFQLRVANEHDVIDHLIEQQQTVKIDGKPITSRRTYQALLAASSRRFNQRTAFLDDARLQKLVDRVRKRLLEVELKRADLPTDATFYVKGLRYVGGLEVLFPLLEVLHKMPLERAWATQESKKASFSHILRATFPGEADTPAAFAALQKEYNIPEKRLLEVAMYTPQWAKHVTELLGWEGLDEAVWWFHGHTRDRQWKVDKDTKADWASEIAERTPLSAKNLTHGAVDVTWFHHAYGLLGDERWQKLHGAAKMASTAGGHKRAQLYAETMLGQRDEAALIERIKDKRFQDGIRALGLFPLAGAAAAREQQLLKRYLLIQEFLKGSKKFGSQRQRSEKRAIEIGMENLARTAGYPDPLRLQWAMEQQAVADLAESPVVVAVDETMVTLSVDFLGNPQIAVKKAGKTLKSVPAKLRKLPEIKALQERKKELKAQGSRMRKSLEQAMMRGDAFTAGELQKLTGHPVMKPLLEDLVFISDTEEVMGYPADEATQLSGVEGAMFSVKSDTQLRIAHPYDLFEAGNWDIWQRDCFRAERIQPFKQLFRELYVVTPAELEVVNRSMRFAGQQVNPRQAMTLLGQNEWIVRREEGIHRTFHAADLTAWLYFADGMFYGTPADAGGTLTLDKIQFTKRGEWKLVPLADIPPRIFSTVMRNLDLVVSVAHAGGIDPEATMSTKESRAVLVQESAELLNLSNVNVTSSHVQIEGSLSKYTIHLGSGVVHMQPGGYVCIVPVGAQQRGRVFLPFVDSDPKSAEIIAKTVMLARDQKIKDPSILQQIVRG